ncbi:MAG: PIG-L family deacetylase, partial [Ignavibacteriales bacterium]|nr:PIG-L family deacetylase [Ignavibacteriales bacterium]
MKIKIISLFVLSFILIAPSVGVAQAPRVMDAAELRVALNKLTVLGSVLYVAAHPDDENTAFLAYMANGRYMRTAYLAVTRGEGGQNLIGSEQGDQMGIIRTQELLAARRIDGAEQFFTRAIDFGYSKTSEETMRIWGKEKILSDVVWVIRKFRPDVIVTRFTPTQGGHGNHTSSAALTEEAFRLAGDPTKFPEQLKYVQSWQPKRLLWNAFRFQQSDNPAPPPNAIGVDLGEYSALLGKSFTEIAGQSRSMHKSQGFGAGQNRGEFVNYFTHTAGDTAKKDLLDGVDVSWSRVKGGGTVGKLLEEARQTYDPQNPAKLLPLLVMAYKEVEKLGGEPWVEAKKKELVEVIKSCAGIWIDALASDYSAVAGGEIKITATAINRSEYPFTLKSLSIPFRASDTLMNAALTNNKLVRATFAVRLPENLKTTQPYWLREPHQIGSYQVTEQEMIGQPEAPAALKIVASLVSHSGTIDIEVPVRYRSVDPVAGELYRPFEVIPPVALNLHEKIHVFSGDDEKKISVTLRSGAANISGEARLNVPNGWKVKPEKIPFSFINKNEEQVVTFSAKPNKNASSSTFFAEATVGNQKVSQGIVTIRYSHIPPQTLFPPAEGKLLLLDLKGRGESIGYIMGPGDEIPTALRQLGYRVTLLSDDDLANANLSQFDAIVAGVRAYNTRPQLKIQQKRLMDYTQPGGTYIMQYTTFQQKKKKNL